MNVGHATKIEEFLPEYLATKNDEQRTFDAERSLSAKVTLGSAIAFGASAYLMKASYLAYHNPLAETFLTQSNAEGGFKFGVYAAFISAAFAVVGYMNHRDAKNKALKAEVDISNVKHGNAEKLIEAALTNSDRFDNTGLPNELDAQIKTIDLSINHDRLKMMARNIDKDIKSKFSM